MTEKELLKKLHSYKGVQADQTWKEKNREVLFNQIINSSSTPEAGFSFAKLVNNFKIYSDTFYNGIVKNMGQPVILTSLIVVFVLGGGVVSISASRDTTPGDSLYIAKKISEKTQIALTFDEKKKAQLNVSFAEKRAQEIVKVMSEEKPEQEKQEIVEKLTGDFKQEISNVKNRIEKIAQKEKEESEKNTEEPAVETAEEALFTANLGKGDDGLSFGEPISEGSEVVEEGTAETENVTSEKAEVIEIESTSTVEMLETSTSTATSSEEKKEDNNSDILSEVRTLIENDDYSGTLERLDEINDTFEEVSDSGEVKGVTEEKVENESGSASSTEE